MGTNKHYRPISEDRTFRVQDSMGKLHTIHKLNSDEFKKYIDKEVQPDIAFFEKYGVRLYTTNDGRAIVEESGNYAMYPSVIVLLDTIAKSRIQPSSFSVFYGRNPYGRDFPLYASGIVDDLYTEFGIFPENKSDKELINLIDDIIVRKRSADFFDKYYLSFAAFIGQLFINSRGAKWKMILSNDKQTWTPVLAVGNEEVFFVDYIQEDVNNLDQNRPLQEVYGFITDIFRIRLGK